MVGPDRAARLTTISFVCPLWCDVAEVTAVCDEGGNICILNCPLCQPGSACAAPCEEDVRRWCEYSRAAA